MSDLFLSTNNHRIRTWKWTEMSSNIGLGELWCWGSTRPVSLTNTNCQELDHPVGLLAKKVSPIDVLVAAHDLYNYYRLSCYFMVYLNISNAMHNGFGDSRYHKSSTHTDLFPRKTWLLCEGPTLWLRTLSTAFRCRLDEKYSCAINFVRIISVYCCALGIWKQSFVEILQFNEDSLTQHILSKTQSSTLELSIFQLTLFLQSIVSLYLRRFLAWKISTSFWSKERCYPLCRIICLQITAISNWDNRTQTEAVIK